MPWYSTAWAWVAGQLRKAAIWVVFVVFFALLPLIFVYNNKRTGGEALTIDDLISGGELLLVVTAVAADSLGRLVSSFFSPKRTKKLDLLDLILFLASLVFVVVAASEYSSLLTRLSLRGSVDAAYVASQSRGFFWATLLTGIGVILAVED